MQHRSETGSVAATWTYGAVDPEWISHVAGSNRATSRRVLVLSAKMAPSCAHGSVLRVLLLAGPALSHGLPPSGRVGLPPSVLSGLSGPEDAPFPASSRSQARLEHTACDNTKTSAVIATLGGESTPAAQANTLPNPHHHLNPHLNPNPNPN